LISLIRRHAHAEDENSDIRSNEDSNNYSHDDACPQHNPLSSLHRFRMHNAYHYLLARINRFEKILRNVGKSILDVQEQGYEIGRQDLVI